MKLSKLVLSGFIVCGLVACSEDEPTIVENYMEDPDALQRGQALFTGTCAGYCHSLTPDDSDAVFLFDCEWKHGGSDEEIFATISNGVPGTRMVGFGTNFPEGEEDLWKLIAYLRANQRNC